jgi:L-alanine-DL-glutamate epimerase-like enolase superfamily enzyme
VPDAPLLLIDVLTDAGVTGRAYAFAYTPLTLHSLAQFVRDIAPELIGKSVSPRARMRQMEKRLKLVGWQGLAGMVVGTLDMALWDALARAINLPLAVLLGGEIRPLPASYIDSHRRAFVVAAPAVRQKLGQRSLRSEPLPDLLVFARNRTATKRF